MIKPHKQHCRVVVLCIKFCLDNELFSSHLHQTRAYSQQQHSTRSNYSYIAKSIQHINLRNTIHIIDGKIILIRVCRCVRLVLFCSVLFELVCHGPRMRMNENRAIFMLNIANFTNKFERFVCSFSAFRFVSIRFVCIVVLKKEKKNGILIGTQKQSSSFYRIQYKSWCVLYVYVRRKH